MAQDLRPGDCVFFHRRALRDVGFIGWLGDLGTSLAQWLFCSTAQGNYDGFYRYCHVGVCVEWYNEVHLLEWMPGGMQLRNAAARLATHRGGITVIPLSDRYQQTAFFDPGRIYKWIEEHEHDEYRWGGLPFSILHNWLGAPAPGRMFCSEAVMTLYLALGIAPPALPVQREHIAQGQILPHAYAPCEIADLDQLARARMYEYPRA